MVHWTHTARGIGLPRSVVSKGEDFPTLQSFWFVLLSLVHSYFAVTETFTIQKHQIACGIVSFGRLKRGKQVIIQPGNNTIRYRDDTTNHSTITMRYNIVRYLSND